MHIRFLRQMTVAVALCTAMACGMPVSLGPSPGPPPLEIRGATFMMVGGRGTLTAWQFKDGQAREVSARWTAEGDAISITSGGAFVARRLGYAIVRANYDDQSGTATVHVVTSVAGVWRGSVTVMGCGQSIVTLPDPCESRRGLTGPIVLTVSQSASAEHGNITATIAVFTPPATGPFVGLLDSAGTFFLQGYVQRPSDGLSGGFSGHWQLDGERLVPMNFSGPFDDIIDVGLSSRISPGVFTEAWKISALTR